MFDNYLELHIIFKTDYASLLANKLFWKLCIGRLARARWSVSRIELAVPIKL